MVIEEIDNLETKKVRREKMVGEQEPINEYEEMKAYRLSRHVVLNSLSQLQIQLGIEGQWSVDSMIELSQDAVAALTLPYRYKNKTTVDSLVSAIDYLKKAQLSPEQQSKVSGLETAVNLLHQTIQTK